MTDTTKPHLSLDALVRAAWRMHEADALPVPCGVDLQRMADAGQMRPWIEEALGPDGAAKLMAAGRGGWWLGALLGRNFPDRRDDSSVTIDEADRGLLMLVDRMCSFARSGPWFLTRDALDEATPETRDFLVALEREVFRDVDRARASGEDRDGRPVVRRVLAEVARLRDVRLAPLTSVVDVGDGTAQAVVVDVRPPSVQDRIVHREARTSYSFEAADGHRWTWVDRYGSFDFSRRPPLLGAGVELRLRGVTAGGRGYVTAVETHAAQREAREVRALCRMSEPLPPALDVDGVTLVEEDAVELLHGCLEASEGALGTVVDVAGDMAVVRFVGRRKPVPCYAVALRRVTMAA